ncbi:MerR family transcriptional regulator [Streptomyces aculeolatus]|jgi:DNA-binding transcriptional MerR regulator|uniref:MerR family transcriptional regulator n=1 Tax=Streptomyces aculeolatus TaxID=270689 RepID=UPI000C2457F0|nr:MerR family transcriptional regulator [Streptomyces aculeolatus]
MSLTAAARVRPVGQDHYSISEVASYTGLSAHTLRWYERIGLLNGVHRSHTGQRLYTDGDLDWLDLIGKLRLTGMPVADMVRYAELVRAGDQTMPERTQLFREHREVVRQQIEDLRTTLAVLDFKIEFYEGASSQCTP